MFLRAGLLAATSMAALGHCQCAYAMGKRERANTRSNTVAKPVRANTRATRGSAAAASLVSTKTLQQRLEAIEKENKELHRKLQDLQGKKDVPGMGSPEILPTPKFHSAFFMSHPSSNHQRRFLICNYSIFYAL